MSEQINAMSHCESTAMGFCFDAFVPFKFVNNKADGSANLLLIVIYAYIVLILDNFVNIFL